MRFGIKNNVTGEVVLTSWYAQRIEDELERIRTRDGEDALEDYDYLSDVDVTAQDLRAFILNMQHLATIPLYRKDARNPSLVITRGPQDYLMTFPASGVIVHFDGCIPDGLEDDILLLTMKEMTVAEVCEVWDLCTETHGRGY